MKDVKTTWITKEKVPLVMEPIRPEKWTATSFYEWLSKNREELGEKVLRYGGILFRGFPVEGADGFSASIQALNFGKPLNYIGGDSPRDKVQGQVYTSTEAPKRMTLPLHNEMSFIRDYPKHIYFYSHIPAAVGGATILGDGKAILRAMDPKIRKKFESKGLRYVSNYFETSLLHEYINKIQRGHKSWKEVFETTERSEVERLCRENGFEFSWKKRGWLQIAQHTAATTVHPETKEHVWFNQAHLYDFNPRLIGFWNWVGTKCVYWRPNTQMHEISYGTGEPISRSELYHIMDVLDRHTIAYPWQKKDFLVLDNVLVMHGRAPFKGPRKTLTALTR